MPQLIPFYFLNVLFSGYVVLFILLVLVARVILPYVVSLHLIRTFIIKL